MDRRVFQPRSNGNEERRRIVLRVALAVLLACLAWMFGPKGMTGRASVNPPPAAPGQVRK